MKKNLTISVLYVLTMLLCGIFTGSVFAGTQSNCASDKNSLTDTLSAAPEASATVVINEVYGGSEASDSLYNADFIELYNRSGMPIDISDYSVQYYTAGQINAGAPTHTAHIPDATIMAAFSYYIIRISPIRATGAALPCTSLDASATFAETGIAPDAGKLVLSSTRADLAGCTTTSNLVVDRVGYGITPIVCNETTNASAPSATASVQRRAGESDTDNNGVNFASFAPPTPCARLLGPTAATVNVGGRAINSYGIGIGNVVISMTDSNGIVRTAVTGADGVYGFADIPAGMTLVLNAGSKRFTFSQPIQVINAQEDNENVDFVALYAVKSRNQKRAF